MVGLMVTQTTTVTDDKIVYNIKQDDLFKWLDEFGNKRYTKGFLDGEYKAVQDSMEEEK